MTLIAAYLVYVVIEAAKQPLGIYMTDPRGLRFQVVPVLVLVPVNFALSWWLTAPLGATGPILGSAVSVLVCQLVPYTWWDTISLTKAGALLCTGSSSGRFAHDGSTVRISYSPPRSTAA